MTNTTGRMDALKTLYKQVILEHSRHPRNYGDLPGATHTEGGHNPSCGDQLQLQLKLEGDHLQAVQFTAKGCASSTASASLMTQAVKGKTPGEALDLAEGSDRATIDGSKPAAIATTPGDDTAPSGAARHAQ